jgi:4-amino-4-deoxy-L-arabinose transferase-like glycosyltransferase
LTAVTTRWPRLALAALIACTAALYLWNLSATGYGNAFYAAAAQAGAQSWSAWFFGALDARGFITVDKPPGALWVTGLSVRLFGMNSWSVLVPQALMGVTAVAVLFATVRRSIPDRTQGTVAGIVAGAVLACTPAAALMFRFNNPDAFLVLLLVIAAYCLTRAVATASWRWLALAGLVMGTAFLTKMLQGFLVLPGFAAAYLLAAPTSWRSRGGASRRGNRRAGRGRRMVGGHRAGDPRRVTALRRRLEGRHRARSRVRLQRAQPHPW